MPWAHNEEKLKEANRSRQDRQVRSVISRLAGRTLSREIEQPHPSSCQNLYQYSNRIHSLLSETTLSHQHLLNALLFPDALCPPLLAPVLLPIPIPDYPRLENNP